MGWTTTHLDEIELFLFCWAGTWNIFHGLANVDSLQIQLGVLWLCVGFIDYKKGRDR